jgi:hypothetical protein
VVGRIVKPLINNLLNFMCVNADANTGLEDQLGTLALKTDIYNYARRHSRDPGWIDGRLMRQAAEETFFRLRRASKYSLFKYTGEPFMPPTPADPTARLPNSDLSPPHRMLSPGVGPVLTSPENYDDHLPPAYLLPAESCDGPLPEVVLPILGPRDVWAAPVPPSTPPLSEREYTDIDGFRFVRGPHVNDGSDVKPYLNINNDTKQSLDPTPLDGDVQPAGRL